MREVLGSRDVAERLSAAGLERSRGFSWERCAEQTVGVYRELVAR